MSEKNTTISTRSKIIKFINAISAENYAAANKYLQTAVQDKIEARIRRAAKKPLF